MEGGVMTRYLIEAAHDPSVSECLRILDAFVAAGSHYLSRAEWGCVSGDHRAWLMVEADSDDSARLMVPPVIRPMSKVVRLHQFTPEEIKLIKVLTPEERAKLRKLSPEEQREVESLPLTQVRQRLQGHK
jgi:hypothetical protein